MKIGDRLAKRVRIDWLGFAVTHGGFFDLIGPTRYKRWNRGLPALSLTASGGFMARVVPPSTASEWQTAAYAYMQPGWHQWREWFCWPDMIDRMPVFAAPRGGITFVTPPVA